MILVQDKVVSLSFQWSWSEQSSQQTAESLVYIPIGYWNTHQRAASFSNSDKKPNTRRATRYVKRGRYTPKHCTHYRNKDVEIHLVSSRYPPVEDGSSGSGSGYVWRIRHIRGSDYPQSATLVTTWWVESGKLYCGFGWMYDAAGNPYLGNQSGCYIYKVSGTQVSRSVLHRAEDVYPDVLNVGWIQEHASSGTYSYVTDLTSENPYPFQVEETPVEYSFDLKHVFDTCEDGIRMILEPIEKELPLADVLDEALGNYLGPDISWLETLLPLKDTADLAKTMVTVPRTVKELAGYFLAYKYGVAPWPGTIKDIDTMVSRILTDTIRKNHPVRLDAGKHVEGDSWTADVRATVRARVANAAVLTAARLGVADPLTEVWNCVPYSFVVDWFVDLGGALGRLEKRAQWASLELSEILTSYKIRVDLSAHADIFRRLGITSQGYAVLYKRIYHDTLPAQNYFQLPDVPGNIRRHWAEGVALVIQRV